ncbi:tyrosine-type recombinase/integrase, partial [Nonomuraea bangladeshensis]|uniref:tyrosine-type recombinase/integrase n=1 Tax=Nonomuraea bangladeshensis TaxID=404385 RepID=UPI0031E1EB5B
GPAVMDRWTTAAAATPNRHLSALVSFTTWAQHQDLLATNPARRLTRRPAARRGDRTIPAARLETLFTDERHPLRERLLWRLLYETAARADEILSLDVTDLDLERRRARVTPRAVPSSTCTGPPPPPACCPACCKAARQGPSSWPTGAPPPPGRAPATADICPVTGRGRLSYPRAEYLFKNRHRRPRPPP